MDKQRPQPRADTAERLSTLRGTLAAISAVSGRMARNIALLERRRTLEKGQEKHA